MDNITLEDAKLLFWLAARDIIFFTTYNGESHDTSAYPVVFCSDVFCYACADAEELPIDQLPLLKTVFEKFGWNGVVAWVAKQRNEHPLESYITEEYNNALNYIIMESSK